MHVRCLRGGAMALTAFECWFIVVLASALWRTPRLALVRELVLAGALVWKT
jgi:hypothetical protein